MKQSLFMQEEIDSYKESIAPVRDNRSPYDHVIVDSAVEREFAESCEQDQNIKFYIKLPSEFKIKTPLGNYNPDWALSLHQDEKEKLYFIVETKGSTSSEDLHPTELAKIRCGEKHFEAIDAGIVFKRASEQQVIYSYLRKDIMAEIKFVIIEHIGVISESSKRWKKEPNIISWNGEEPKYDLRDWDPNEEKMGKGITLTKDELDTLKKDLNS